jgi:hypothetical protein
MTEKKELHYAFARGNKGRWIFPVEIEPSSAKIMRDDGVLINLAQAELIRTDTMKTYGVHVQGDNKSWGLLSLLEPEFAQEMRNGGVGISDEMVYEKPEEKVVNEEPEELVDEKPEVVVEEKPLQQEPPDLEIVVGEKYEEAIVSKKSKPKEKVSE